MLNFEARDFVNTFVVNVRSWSEAIKEFTVFRSNYFQNLAIIGTHQYFQNCVDLYFKYNKLVRP
jgi:hypothetical protein